MIHSILTAMQQPWYVFSGFAVCFFMFGLLCDHNEVRNDWVGSIAVFIMAGIFWPVTVGFLLGSLAQRWLK